MGKSVRNTLFTLLAIGLSALGLSWNKVAVGDKEPLLARRSIVSAEKSTSLNISLPLKVTLLRPIVKIGQYQEVSVQTSPGAVVEVATTYPTTNSAEPQVVKAVADASGQYVLKYQLTDRKYLGAFSTKVTVSIGGRSATETKTFVFQKWGAKETPADTSFEYQYPLIP